MATELAVEDTDFPFHAHRAYSFSPQPGHDIVLNNLLDALRATVAHPDEAVQALAAATLSEVRRLEKAARRKLAAQRREISAKRLELLIEQIAAALRIDAGKLRGRARKQHIAFQRQTAMYLARRLSTASFPSIAAAFDRDHSTCIWAFQLIERRMVRDSAFRLFIEKLEGQITGTVPATAAAA
jgi:chromosomal replication initiation ATPase DnaA